MSRLRSISICLVALVLSIGLLLQTSCGQESTESLWTIVAIPQGRLDSLNRVEKEVLVLEGRKHRYLELFLRHDNRTEQMQISLVWQLCKRNEVLHCDTISLRLSENQTRWIGQELVTHEVLADVPYGLYVERAGVYQLNFYIPQGESIQGVSTIGFRLR